MTGHPRRPGSALRVLIALTITLLLARDPRGRGPGAGRAPPSLAAPAALLPAWDGSIDLYRDGVFTTQKSWLWCTAAGVQIVRNIVERDNDHSTSGQRRYFDWMRKRNRYDLPESAGVDPQGWTAGLRHFVDDRYRLVASRSFSAGLRSAAANLRRTGLPAALTVSNGGHGWILTGFEATADPLLTDEFEVTSVRVVGPLFGRQSKNGYDMPPDTELSTERVAPLLHAVAIRPARDGLGRQVRLDAAGREGPQAAGRLGGSSGQVRARDPRDPGGGPLAVGPSASRASRALAGYLGPFGEDGGDDERADQPRRDDQERDIGLEGDRAAPAAEGAAVRRRHHRVGGAERQVLHDVGEEDRCEPLGEVERDPDADPGELAARERGDREAERTCLGERQPAATQELRQRAEGRRVSDAGSWGPARDWQRRPPRLPRSRRPPAGRSRP